MKKLTLIPLLIGLIGLFGAGCDMQDQPTSDETQRAQQEKLLQEGTSETGMPDIKNFRERKLMKLVLEKRDQEGLVTYVYLENTVPTPIPGQTVFGGKLTYIGQAIGFPLPYSTEYTNPQKTETYGQGGITAMAQADPNGLFSPADAEGTWVLMINPQTKQDEPEYFEPRVVCLTFQPPFDQAQQ